MGKKFRKSFLLTLLALVFFSVNTAYAATGWVNNGSITYYYKSDGTKATGWQTIDNKRYYFYSTGGMAKGWLKLPGDRNYYLKNDGVMATGFQTIENKKYYFYSTGGMAEGWLSLPGGRKYYFNNDGTAATGFRTVDNKKYYFYSTGGMATGWLNLPGRKYYSNSDGILVTGEQTIDGKKYVFSSTGELISAASGWVVDGSITYYYKADGTKATGFQTIDNKKYYFYSTGGMAKGWLNLPDRKYYLNDDGVMVTGEQVINEKTYVFSSTGELLREVLTTGWVKDGTRTYYYKSDGTKAIGWQVIAGKKYYFNSSGVMVTSDITLSGKNYSFFSDGSLKSEIAYTNYSSTLSGMVNTNLNLNPPGQTDKYRNVPVYIHSDFLTITSNDVVNGTSVALRTDPNDSSTAAVYARVDSGTGVSVVDDNVVGFEYQGSTRWYKVLYDNQELYVHSLLVSRGEKVAVTTARVNVRETPMGHIFATVNEGSSYSVLDDSDVWVKVDFRQTWRNAKSEDIEYYLNPANFGEGTKTFYQFLNLSQNAGISASEINSKILYNKGILKDKGQAFIDGSKQYNVNELYLVSHAALETGNGTSPLATGVLVSSVDGQPVEPRTVYNMYGIGAVDGAALKEGSEYAYKAGWFTPEAAIIGGAKFIGERYINHTTYKQDTLYKMRWNPNRPGTHQYATDIGWAAKQVTNIYNMYQLLEYYTLYYDVPKYSN